MKLFLGLLLGCLVLLSPDLRADATAAVSDAGKVALSLDGSWQCAQDLKNTGINDSWFDPAKFPAIAAKPILVPGSSPEVYTADSWRHDGGDNILWYSKTFQFPLETKVQPHTHYYLRFGAVMQSCDVWLNGTKLGAHDGGENPFEFDVTSLLQPGKPNTVVVRVKLWWVAPVPMGGINQHVAIIAQPDVRIIDAFAQPDSKTGNIKLDVTLENNTTSPAQVEVSAAYGQFKPAQSLGDEKTTITAAPGNSVATLVLPVKNPRLWDLQNPFLYTIAVTSNAKSSDGSKLTDAESFRTGFRDFRMVDGYFTLNGKRMLLKSTHGNWYDPVSIQGTPRDMRWLSRDFPQLKNGGFNTLRFIISAAMPEQLEQADEMGFLIWSEHQSSWQLKDPTKFGLTINDIVRRDRNHPSLVLWGLLNETDSQDIYHRAKAWLPSLRALDTTRPVILSSGRWDRDGRTASISNAGSADWDVYLGGENSTNPKPYDPLGGMGDGQQNIPGDNHIYPHYPIGWGFATDFDQMDLDNPHPFLFSESGIGGFFDAIQEKDLMLKAHAPATANAWTWINAVVDRTARDWPAWDMQKTYPKIEDAFTDSNLDSARQRDLLFTIIRSNPQVNGYNLTSLEDVWGSAEGVLNGFRDWKAGHLQVMQNGWAPLRWCLLINPMNVYADDPLHLKISLANEDVLPAGDYPATVQIKGPTGMVWKQAVTAHVQDHGPLAYKLFDDDVHIPGLKAGVYQLEASLDGKPNAKANTLSFTVADRAELPKISGPVTTAGVPSFVRDLLVKQGATLRDFAVGQDTDHEVVMVGDDFKGKATDWRALYARAARGAHLVFISSRILHADNARNKWLALPAKGDQADQTDWLYHKVSIAKADAPAFAGLPPKVMTADFYGDLLGGSAYFHDMTPPAPADVAAVAIYNPVSATGYQSGIMLATYPFHTGHFTISGFNINGTMGHPATDRLLLNLVKQAQADAAPLAPLPTDYDAEMDKLGFKD